MYRFIKMLGLLLICLSSVGCVSTGLPTFSEAPKEVPPQEKISFVNTDEKSVEYTIKPTLSLVYNPDNSLEYSYNLNTLNESKHNMIVDLAISADGRIIKELTIRIDAYKSVARSGELWFDDHKIRKFTVKITNVLILTY